VRVRTDMPYQPFGIYRQNVGKCRQERDRSASKKHDGWELEDDTYNITWFDGDQFPGTLVSNVGENDDDFVLSSDDEAGILVPTSRPPQIPNRLTVPDCL